MKTLFTFILALTVNLALAQISITRPIQNSVLQRNNDNSASVSIAGQAVSPHGTLYGVIQYRIQQLSPQNSAYLSTPVNWTSFSSDYGGLFNFSVNLSGGWYQLDVKSSITGAQIASVKFGVGEVFIIAGQSNAQGVTTSNIYNGPGSSPYDGVIADLHQENTGCLKNETPLYPSLNKLTVTSPVAPQGPNNWCYTVLGNQLVDNIGVPVAFFNAAQTTTGVRNWVESIQNPNSYTYETYHNSPNYPAVCAAGYTSSTSLDGGPGHPYIALKKTMQFYGSLFGARSILWHQGENDAHDANASITNGSEYMNRLRTVINQARSDFSHADLSWWICKVSYTDASATGYSTNADILAAQGTVQTDSYNKAGPYTDGIGPRNMLSNDYIHFTDTGLRDLGYAWYNTIGGTPLTSANPVASNATLPVMLLNNSSGGFNLLAAGGYTQYFWLSAGQDLNSSAPTGSTVTGAIGGNSYICYARHSNGQWYISAKVLVPTSGSPRVGVSSETDDFLSYSVWPNPAQEQIQIRFILDAPAQVNLTLIDPTGKVVKQLVNGRHGEGSFTYPVDMSGYAPGLYLCNLTADALHLSRKIIKQAK